MADRQVFLIQSSGGAAEHDTAVFKDRTYADEVAKHGYYRHDGWDTPARRKDQVFGKAHVGDYVLHYCTGDVDSSPSQIRNIYEVIGTEKLAEEEVNQALKEGRIDMEEAKRLLVAPHVLRLRLHLHLTRGLELSQIRAWVKDGQLSENMGNCGRLGFNICQVDYGDYEAIVEWNKTLPVEPLTTIGSLLEEDVRRFIVQRPIHMLFGEEYVGYELYSDNEGRTGELFDTGVVGQIDLLYKNPKTGGFLVIELKRTDDTADSAVGQIARYIGWVVGNLGKSLPVQSMLIVRSASEELRYAVKALRECRLVTFEIDFKFSVQDGQGP